MAALILAQASGREMEVLQKLFQYFLLDKLCRFLKPPKGEVSSGKASKTRSGWVRLEEQDQPLKQRSPPDQDRAFLSENGRHAKLLFVCMMLSHKHPLGICILIQDVVFLSNP